MDFSFLERWIFCSVIGDGFSININCYRSDAGFCESYSLL